MKRRSVDAIVGALNVANVRYLVAGGLAVVAHGYVRFTADIDVIVDLEASNVLRAVTLKQRAGRPQDLLDLEKLNALGTEGLDE